MRRLAPTLPLVVLLAAGCADDDAAAPEDTQIDPVEETGPGRPFLARSIVVDLDASGGSGTAGVATLSPIQGGAGTTQLDTPLEALVEGEEALAVVLRAGGSTVACGNVEEQTEE